MLPLAWFFGGLAGSVLNTTISFPIPALSFLILGGLVAADLCMPVNVITGLAIVFGLVHGFLNGAVLVEGARTTELIGVISMLFVMVTMVSALVVSLKRPWERIVVRVTGSWIAAVGFLMIGWAVR